MPVYRAALRSVGDEQEVMIGYSDSNKDVGYLASAWAAYQAQVGIAEVLRGHGLGWLFFHGRGGAVGRGGGPTNRAIRALPAGTVGARLKMTEQGEVLTAKYAVPQIAHRELELTTSATLATGRANRHSESARFDELMDEMAAESARQVPLDRGRRSGFRAVLRGGDAGRRDLAAPARVPAGEALAGGRDRRSTGDPVGVLVDPVADRVARLARPRDGAARRARTAWSGCVAAAAG